MLPALFAASASEIVNLAIAKSYGVSYAPRPSFYGNLSIVLHYFVRSRALLHCLVYIVYIFLDQGLLVVNGILDLWIISTWVNQARRQCLVFQTWQRNVCYAVSCFGSSSIIAGFGLRPKVFAFSRRRKPGWRMLMANMETTIAPPSSTF
jgi:hypothetical protein